MEIPDDLLTKILTKLPLKSIARFRSLNKTWKSRLDSDFFRDQYMSLNNASSVSWSIINTEWFLEIVGHHGCERWGLTRSLGDLMRINTAGTAIRGIVLLTFTDGLVSIYTVARDDGNPRFYIGNLLLKQWTEIHIPYSMIAFRDFVMKLRYDGCSSVRGLVTKMEKGVVVSYKVVWMLTFADFSDTLWSYIYSSETGIWNVNKSKCVRPMLWIRLGIPTSLNGVLHWLTSDDDDEVWDANCIVAYDLYKYDDDCIVLCFPDAQQDDHERRFKRTFTTSEGSLVYFNEYIDEKGGRTFRVWKLLKYSTDDPTVWHLSWQIKLGPLMIEYGVESEDYFPVVMHPLNFEEIYLWSTDVNSMIVLNLRTYELSVHGGDGTSECMDGCIMSFKCMECCKKYMDRVYTSFLTFSEENTHDVYFAQYILPKWMPSIPHLQPQPQPHPHSSALVSALVSCTCLSFASPTDWQK